MRTIYAMLFLIYTLCIMVYHLHKDKDVFSPMVMFTLLAIAHYLPGIWFLEKYSLIDIDEKMALIVFVFESIAVFFTVFGYFLYNHTFHKVDLIEVEYTKVLPLHSLGIIFYIIGFVGGILFLRRIGGLTIIFGGIKGVHAGNGNSYIRALMFLMVLGMCIIMYDRHRNGKRPISVGMVILFVVYSFFFFIQTSRSPILEAFMILVMAYHYCVKKITIIDILRPRSIAVIIICILFIVVMPSFRTTSGFKGFSLNNAVKDGVRNISNIFDELCYVGRDGFVFENYDFEKRWHGSNFINLILAPIPSAIFPGKPPVDDGMYLANAMIGHFIKPPSADLPWYNSLPFSTPSGLYTNFGIIGIVLGSIILGWIYGAMYSKLKASNYDIIYVILYQLVMYQFEFSVLSTVQTLTPVVFVYASILIIGGRKVYKSYRYKKELRETRYRR